MRTTPPHALIRYRHALLVLALTAWVVAVAMLLLFKGNPDVPVAPVVAAALFVFTWANGGYWWVMIRYPYIEVAKGQYASRDEWKGGSNRLFFVAYFTAAVFASIACINVALNG
jgi:hypothetical protein